MSQGKVICLDERKSIEKIYTGQHRLAIVCTKKGLEKSIDTGCSVKVFMGTLKNPSCTMIIEGKYNAVLKTPNGLARKCYKSSELMLKSIQDTLSKNDFTLLRLLILSDIGVVKEFVV